MKLAVWVQLLAFRNLLGEQLPAKVLYTHWQERLLAWWQLRQNLQLTKQHIIKQQTLASKFKQAHNLVAFEHPTQQTIGSVFNQVR
jgi:hypothetical protein